MRVRKPLYHTRHQAFTLVELLVAFAVIGILLAMILPAINAARESARRATCQNHLKQIGLALLNHENSSRRFPVGAKSQLTFGVSWWVGVLPFLEGADTYNQFDLHGAHNGSALMHGQNGSLVDGLEITTMICPSSPLDSLWRVGSFRLMMPSYVGISGATNHQGFVEPRTSPCCVSDGNEGQISAGGMLVPNRDIRMREVYDGLSKTLIVSEASDQVLGPTGIPTRIDGGYPHGWITGTSATGTSPNYNAGFSPPSWNITTIRYAPNTRDYSLPGINSYRGANNPLISAHTGGVFGVLVDGSVHFLEDKIEISVLKRLATRDDRETM